MTMTDWRVTYEADMTPEQLEKARAHAAHVAANGLRGRGTMFTSGNGFLGISEASGRDTWPVRLDDGSTEDMPYDVIVDILPGDSIIRIDSGVVSFHRVDDDE